MATFVILRHPVTIFVSFITTPNNLIYDLLILKFMTKNPNRLAKQMMQLDHIDVPERDSNLGPNAFRSIWELLHIALTAPRPINPYL